MRLAHSEAADGVTGKIDIEKLTRAFAPQIGKGRALHDAELPLGKIAIVSGLFEEIRARALCPLRGALERGLRFLAGRGRFDALIEDHGDVRSERELNFRGFFRREEVLRAVQMRTEAHALIGHFSQFGKAENLVAAGVRKDSTRPGHELMKPAELADQSVAGAQVEMIGVGEDDFRAELFERFLRQGFDGSLRAHGHEEGSLDRAMRRGQAAAPRAGGVGLRYFKGKLHSGSVSGENPGNGGTQQCEKQVDAYNYAGGFWHREFFRVHAMKTDGRQNDGPDNKNIERRG
jgi:hypothetical protein